MAIPSFWTSFGKSIGSIMAALLRDELHLVVTDCGDGTWEWFAAGVNRSRHGCEMVRLSRRRSPLRLGKSHSGNSWSFWNSDRKTIPELLRSTSGGNGVLQMTNENFARLLRGLTIAVGNRKNRILFYQFLAAEIRALHYSYGIGDGSIGCSRLMSKWILRRAPVTDGIIF